MKQSDNLRTESLQIAIDAIDAQGAKNIMLTEGEQHKEQNNKDDKKSHLTARDNSKGKDLPQVLPNDAMMNKEHCCDAGNVVTSANDVVAASEAPAHPYLTGRNENTEHRNWSNQSQYPNGYRGRNFRKDYHSYGGRGKFTQSNQNYWNKYYQNSQYGILNRKTQPLNKDYNKDSSNTTEHPPWIENYSNSNRFSAKYSYKRSDYLNKSYRSKSPQTDSSNNKLCSATSSRKDTSPKSAKLYNRDKETKRSVSNKSYYHCRSPSGARHTPPRVHEPDTSRISSPTDPKAKELNTGGHSSKSNIIEIIDVNSTSKALSFDKPSIETEPHTAPAEPVTSSSGDTTAEPPTQYSANIPDIELEQNSAEAEAARPKLTLTPLAKLIRNDLLRLNLTNGLNSVNSPTKEATSAINNNQNNALNKSANVYKPNLVKRRRNISTCSNSSTSENLVEKVVNMDKSGIKNVINNSGTKYDEALKLQARKRLHEEIRKQLKTINTEQPRANSANKDIEADLIVESIQIPYVVLDEIRKAFGIDLLENGQAKRDPDQEWDVKLNSIPDVLKDMNANILEHIADTESGDGTQPVSAALQTVPTAAKRMSTDLRTRIQNAKQSKSFTERLPSKAQQQKLTVAPNTDADATRTKPSKTEQLKKAQQPPKYSPEKHQNAHEAKTEEECKKPAKKTKKLPPKAGVIVLDSSSSNNSSRSSSSSSSSSSEESDSPDSRASKASKSSSVIRRRRRQEIISENIVRSFETLILPSISETQKLRYKEKYSASTSIKLHYISCICTSDYNSKKFSKTEIAKVQQNLKAADNSSSLEFLMREIVNVFNKQKTVHKQYAEKRAPSQAPSGRNEESPEKSKGRQHQQQQPVNETSELMTPQNKQQSRAVESNKTKYESNRIPVAAVEREATEAPAVKSKTAATAFLGSAREEIQRKSVKSNGAAANTQPMHQSVNEGTSKKAAVTAANGEGRVASGENVAADAKNSGEILNGNTKRKDKDKVIAIDKQNPLKENPNGIMPSPKGGKIGENLENTLITNESQGSTDRPLPQKPASKKIDPSVSHSCIDSTTSSNQSSFDNTANNGDGFRHFSSAFNSMMQDSSVAEAVVANLCEIDKQLMELHQRKMVIEEMILKLQKEKMEADLQTIKLQNEKFLVLNTAMTANATAVAAAAAVSTTSSSSPSTTTNSGGGASNNMEKPSSSTQVVGMSVDYSKECATNTEQNDTEAKIVTDKRKRSQAAPVSNSKKLCLQKKTNNDEDRLSIEKLDAKTTVSKKPQKIIQVTTITKNTVCRSLGTKTIKATDLLSSDPAHPASPVITTHPSQNAEYFKNTKDTPSSSSDPVPIDDDPANTVANTLVHGATETSEHSLQNGKIATTENPLATATTATTKDPSSEPKPPVNATIATNENPVANDAKASSVNSDNIASYDYSNIPAGNLEGIRSPITQICIFENSIIASSENGYLYKFSARTLQLEKHFAKHSEAITQIYLCEEKKVLYTTSLDGYLKKSSIENFDLDIQTIYLEEPLQSIDVQWGIGYIGSRWGNIFTYNIATNNLTDRLLCSSNSSITALKATKEGPRKILIVSSKGNLIHFRDATSGLLLRSLDVADNLHIFSLLLDSGCLYCGTQRSEIHKYDFTTGNRVAVMGCGNGAVSIKLYRNKFLFIGCYDGFIYVLEKENGCQIGRFPGSGKMVLALEIAGDKLITSSKDNSMKIIDIPKYIVAKAKV